MTSASRSVVDPLSAMAEYEWEWEYGRGSWQTRTRTYTRITCDEAHFILQAESQAWENGEPVFSKTWHQKFKRDHF